MCQTWIAHIREDADKTTQSVSEHCQNTARYAQACLADIGLGNTAYLAGLHHDDGKRTQAFQNYLTAAADGKPVQRGSVTHSFTGVRLILESFHASSHDPFELITAELIGYAIGAHHGLFDCVDETGKSGFRHRLTQDDIHYEEAIENLRADGVSPDTTSALFQKATAEVKTVVSQMQALITPGHESELSFYFGLLARLLTAGVIEGDRRDTAEFMDAIPPASSPPPDWEGRLRHLEEKLNQFPSDTLLQQARQQISRQCADFAASPGGVYRLNVPTGAGKTLSSLRFALAHAAKQKKSRIIFTSPLLSILEQNAAVLREYLGDSHMILEHHSNVIQEHSDGTELDKGELLTESWGAPVIITTLVQLLNTLFSGKTTCIRRFQSLCRSVVVIDEVQTVPAKMLSLFNLAVNFLSTVCGATVVLCSATQPCLEETTHGICVPIADMVPHNSSLWEPFRRTQLIDAGNRKLEDIPAFARGLLDQTDSLLIICNKKEEARFLFRQLSDLNCFHLSASMCPQHRRDTLAQIQSRLGNEKVVCISTQVMEAGVDISFGCVIRLTAGMDSVVQAAGRCNRNGESKDILPVYLLNCSDENLGMLREISQAKTATTALLDRFRRNPERYYGDLSGDDAIRDYYRLLYREMPTHYQDFCSKPGTPSLYELLSTNERYLSRSTGGFFLSQAFRTAGQLFRVFDSDTTSVIVPYGHGRDLIQALQSHCSLAELRTLLEQTKPYQVNLYRYQFDMLEQAQGLGCDPSGRIYWLEEGWYDESTGLMTEKQENPFWEV